MSGDVAVDPPTTPVVHDALFHHDTILQLAVGVNANLALRTTCRGLRDSGNAVLGPLLAKATAEWQQRDVKICAVWATKELDKHWRTFSHGMSEIHVARVVVKMMRAGVNRKRWFGPKQQRDLLDNFKAELNAAVTLSNALAWMPRVWTAPTGAELEAEKLQLIDAFYASTAKARRRIDEGKDHTMRCRMCVLYEVIGYRPSHAPTVDLLGTQLADMVEDLALKWRARKLAEAVE